MALVSLDRLPVPVAAAPLSARAGRDAPVSVEARRWLAFAVGSLVVAGLLSLAVVVGRLPGLSSLIADPLFYKRCLVVHVNFALVLWFYAFLSALTALRLPRVDSPRARLAWGVSLAGAAAMVAGAGAPGARPVLANYIPVIDHPLFLAGLACFFLGVLLHLWSAVFQTSVRRSAGLPADALPGIQAAAVALVLAASTWAAARGGLPAGLDPHTHYEFSFWGAGHALQVANVCAMLAVWQWLVAERSGGRPLFPPRLAARLYAVLLLPHFALPLLSWRGALHTTYVEGATTLMRWGIFPVVTVFLLATARRCRPEAGAADPRSRALAAGLAASLGLTLLGFLLGALIRSSTTLVPAHYHAALGGVTAAFMAGAYLLADRVATERGRAQGVRWSSARRQLIWFGLGQAVFALGFAVGGWFGLGRKTYATEQHVRSLGEQLGLGIMGLGGLVVTAAGVWFLYLLCREILSWRQPPPASPTRSPAP
jgi:hypothetical protein